MMRQRRYHKKLRFFLHLNLKSVIMPLRTTMIISPPEDYEDFQEDYAPYPEDCQIEEFPHLWLLREMMHLSRLGFHTEGTPTV